MLLIKPDKVCGGIILIMVIERGRSTKSSWHQSLTDTLDCMDGRKEMALV